MKVLYISTLYPPHVNGGAELVLQSQAQAMAARGHTVTVLTIGPDPGVVVEHRGAVSVLRAEFQNSYFHLPQSRPSLYQRVLWHIKDRDNDDMAEWVRKIAPTIEPDVVCCHNLAGWSISIWKELRRLGIPIVQMLHDQYLLCPKSTMFRAGRNCRSQCFDCRLLRRAHAAASDQVSAVVGVSQFILQRLLDAGCFTHVPIRQVLYNVGAGDIPPVSTPAERASPRELTLGFIGTLTQSKGVTLLLEQFQRAGLKGARIRVAGRGKSEFDAQIRNDYRSAQIEFVGYVAPADFFPSIDVLVVPSLWNDTLPSVVFESLAYGVPVIGSRRGGIPEMVIDGFNGLLFEPDEPRSLVLCLQTLQSSPPLLDALARNCRKSAERFFDEEARTSAEEGIFRSVLLRPPAQQLLGAS